MRAVKLSILAAIVVIGGWFLIHDDMQFKDLISQYIENGEIQTLEARYSPQQIMEEHRKELLGTSERTYKDPIVNYYPYLLLEVKFTEATSKKAREGVVLWSMVDGEMVLNTETWEKTRGFEDALVANATFNDFKIINALARSKGTMTREEMQKELKLEREEISPLLDSARNKHLIIMRGNELQLHFQNPKILVVPQTKMNHWLVTKPYGQAQRTPKKFTRSQIEKIAKASFGDEFTIRKATEIFLPVYSIEVVNPDGSVLTSLWNALNGRRIQPKYIAME